MFPALFICTLSHGSRKKEISPYLLDKGDVTLLLEPFETATVAGEVGAVTIILEPEGLEMEEPLTKLSQ